MEWVIKDVLRMGRAPWTKWSGQRGRRRVCCCQRRGGTGRLPLTLVPLPPLYVIALGKKHRPGRVSLSLLELAMDFGLGVHNHELDDLADKHNRAHVSQRQGTQRWQEAGRRRHLGCIFLFPGSFFVC